MRRPDSYASLQPTHSTIVSIINPSYRCLPAASKHTALPHSHLPHQPNPHSGVRGILRAPSPAGSFLGGFRTPTTGVCRAAVAGRHPKPSTQPDVPTTARLSQTRTHGHVRFSPAIGEQADINSASSDRLGLVPVHPASLIRLAQHH